MDGRMGRLEENIRRTFVLTAFISFGLTDVFRLPVEPGLHLPLQMVPVAENRFLQAGREQKLRRKNPGNALRMTKSHLRRKAIGVKNGRKVKKYAG
jgi:hypothetical protein